MLLGLNDILDMAKTSEERQEMKSMIIDLMEKDDEDIDYSDIPEVTDFSGWKPAKPFLDRIRKNNRRVDAMEKGLPDPDELINRGMGCLADHLGPDGVEMFLHIVIDDRLDYAKWRQETAEPVAAV